MKRADLAFGSELCRVLGLDLKSTVEVALIVAVGKTPELRVTIYPDDKVSAKIVRLLELATFKEVELDGGLQEVDRVKSS